MFITRNATLDNDVCLVYLDKPFQLDGKRAAAIPLGDEQTCATNTQCQVSGWGDTKVQLSYICWPSKSFVGIKYKAVLVSPGGWDSAKPSGWYFCHFLPSSPAFNSECSQDFSEILDAADIF